MATAIPHDQRQPIEIIPPRPTDEAEQISALLSLFDDALVMSRKREALAKATPGVSVSCGRLFTVWPSEMPHAEYAARLWASAHQLAVKELVNAYEPNDYAPLGYVIRSLSITERPDDPYGSGEVFGLQWSTESFAGPVRPPLSNLLTLPVELRTDPPPPAEAATDLSEHDDLDDSARRFSLLEID